MQSKTSTLEIAERWNSRQRRRGAAFTAALVLACAGLGAAPASADNELRNGFEDQIGRLLAVQAFHVGRVALFGGHLGHHDYRTHEISQPIVEVHYHPGSRGPCSAVHERVVYHDHRRLSRRERHRARAYRHSRRHHRRWHY